MWFNFGFELYGRRLLRACPAGHRQAWRKVIAIYIVVAASGEFRCQPVRRAGSEKVLATRHLFEKTRQKSQVKSLVFLSATRKGGPAQCVYVRNDFLRVKKNRPLEAVWATRDRVPCFLTQKSPPPRSAPDRERRAGGGSCVAARPAHVAWHAHATM